MSASTDAEAYPQNEGQGGASVMSAFTGEFAPTRVSFLYQFALVVVAFTMVLLPLIYIGLIGFTGYGVYYHAVHNVAILSSGRGGSTGPLIVYAGPILVGLVLIFFMVKPFFARAHDAQQPMSISHTDNPMLFAFIGQICRLVEAPLPSRVDVDCQVNASASFRAGLRSLFSNDVVLTIGLPLVAGMNMQQFAGVLAHEFGHFAQGAGMRLTFVIRTISFWFARVVYERDEWDMQLEAWAKGGDLWLSIILHMARGCVWLSRRLLWVLMMIGNAISCFMLRQMEYDADSYEAKLAGSEAFRETSERLRVLGIGSQAAYHDLGESWKNRRLPENFPSYIQHRAATLSPEMLEKINADMDQRKTGVFDTHPADTDRVRAANRLAQPGVFHLTEPAGNLFGDFTALCRQTTKFHYENNLGLNITDENLVALKETLDETQVKTEANKAIDRYFGDMDLGLLPIGVEEPEGVAGWDREQVAAMLRELKQWLADNRATNEAWLKLVREQEGKLQNLSDAGQLLRAGFNLKPETFGLTTSKWDDVKQTTRVETKSQDDALEQLKFLQQALGRRLGIALNYQLRFSEAAESRVELLQLIPLQQRLIGVFGQLLELRRLFQSFNTLLQNRDPNTDVTQLDIRIEKVAEELRELRAKIRMQLKDCQYPFPHAGGQVSVNRYLEHDRKCSHQWEILYHDCAATLDRLYSLYFRILGRLILIAEQVETQLEPPAAVTGNDAGGVAAEDRGLS